MYLNKQAKPSQAQAVTEEQSQENFTALLRTSFPNASFQSMFSPMSINPPPTSYSTTPNANTSYHHVFNPPPTNLPPTRSLTTPNVNVSYYHAFDHPPTIPTTTHNPTATALVTISHTFPCQIVSHTTNMTDGHTTFINLYKRKLDFEGLNVKKVMFRRVVR